MNASQPAGRVPPGAARILVTGAGSGIGRAIALTLAREGARLALLGRREAQLVETRERVERAGGRGLVVAADVTSEAEVAAAAQRVGDAFGGLEGLVNNAGRAHFGVTEETSAQTWREVLEVNLTGAFLITRAALPWLRRGRAASVVNVASTLARQGLPGAGAYAAAKSGLVAWTRVLALEIAAFGMRANAVSPGPVLTEMLTGPRSGEEDARARLARLAERHPLGRIATPEDVAGVVAQLLGEGSAFVTGAEIVVDGGLGAGATD